MTTDLPALPEPLIAAYGAACEDIGRNPTHASAKAYRDLALSNLRECIAARDAEIARLQAAFEDECNRTDSLLTILGVPAERCRSEGGSLIPSKVLTLMGEARLSAAPPAAKTAALDWPRLRTLINQYAGHVVDGSLHQSESRADISKTAALKVLGEIRRAIEGEPK